MTINSGSLFVGNGVGTLGTFNQSGGLLSVSNGDTTVGGGGPAAFNQSGGTHSTSYLFLGAGAAGTYNLSASGNLIAPNESVGFNYGSSGVFNQTGGTNTASNYINIGDGSPPPLYAGPGTYNISGGTLDTASLNVGENANGVLNVSNGATVNVTNAEVIGNAGYAPGTVNLSGGSLITGTTYVGYSGNGVFNQSGGLQSVGGTLYISYNGTASTGVFSLTGGVLSAGTVQLNANGTFNQTGGTLDTVVFNQNGGLVTGTLQNTGTFNYSSGTFSGRLINQGAVNVGTYFTAGNGIENDATMSIATGYTVVANGAGFDNLGTLNLQYGGNLTGGPLTNDYGGVMNAAGTVGVPFLNNGQLNLTGLLTLSSAATNVGVINIAASDSMRTSGLTNSGTIDLTGGSVSGTGTLTNSPGGFIEGGGGIVTVLNNGGLIYATSTTPLVITTLTGNLNGGELRIANNSTLTVTNPFSSSGGVVTLQGSNASFTGGAITNTGTIQGAGRLTDSLVNTGIIRANGGQLIFSAAGIVNNAPGQIQAVSGNIASFTQGLTNAGTIALAGGTLDTASAILNNTGQLLGNGTVTSGGVLNSGTVFFSDIASAIYGAVTNTGQIQITSNTTDFYGFVNNTSGTISTSSAIARYLAGASIGGSYKSDPSQNYFTDLTVTPTGALIGGTGDQYIVTNDYISSSTQSAEWNTQGSTLRFTGGGTHNVNVTSPFSSAFEWGTMQVDSGNTAYLSGNGLAALTTTNSGSIQQISGSSSLGVLAGGGSITVGGAGSSAQATVSSFSQTSVTVADLGTLSVSSVVPAPTNLANTLSITGSGKLDLANGTLITSTSSNTIRQYLINGYHNGAWNGTSGIDSSNANASYNIPASNGGHSTALGYSSGTTIAALGLTAGQTLVKYTIYGDANLDGIVDINDLNIVLSNFLSGNPATWDTGDFYYAGETDISDLNAVLSNFFDTAPTTVRAAKAAARASASTASTAKTLTGTVSPADTVSPPPANGVLELVVNTTSGDVELEGNNADIASLQITSASSGIITANWTDLHANGYTNWSDTAKKKTGIGEYDNQFTATGDYAVLGVVDYGDIYNTSVNAEDYVFKYGSVESNDTTVDTDTGSVIYVSGVPEPTTLSLMGLAAAGLLGRRRKKTNSA